MNKTTSHPSEDTMVMFHSKANWLIPLSELRQDRPTGVNDLTGKEIFECDEVEWTYMDDYFRGFIVFEDGCFYAKWSDGTQERLCDIDWKCGTITGMVPFGEESQP